MDKLMACSAFPFLNKRVNYYMFRGVGHHSPFSLCCCLGLQAASFALHSLSLSLAQTTANYELMIPENLKATTTRRWIDLAILSLILRLLLPFPSLAILPYWFSRTDPFMRAVSMNNGLFYFYLALFCDFRSSVD